MAVKRFSEFRKGNDRIKVYAKGFNSNRSVQLTGNVTGSAQSDMDEGSTLSIATTIADNAVTNSKLSDGAVSTSKLQDDAVTSAKIDTGAVTVNKLGASAVETDKIANGAVTLNKISTSAIDGEPTDASDNLVTSGGVKTALDAKADKVDDAAEGNFAGFDANGNLTDSGNKASDFATSAQGGKADSAIQGVKVNNTTLTPDANKVVTVPLATTSADGAMSAADKTKLNTAATYTQSSGTAPVKVDANGELTPVPMDSIPTASSTNLMTSGDIKTAMDGKVDVANIDLDGETTTILAEVKALAPKSIHYARFYTRGDGGAADISDKPVSGSGFLCEVLCNRFASTTNYRYILTCRVYVDKNPYWAYVDNTTTSITWSRLNAYVPGIHTDNNLVAMDANGLIKNSGKSPLLGTQTWDGTSDAKFPTAKAVQSAIDAKVKGNADVSGMGTDDTHAYSGKAVSTAISNAITGTTGGFLGNKTVAEINAYASPKMGDNAIVTDTGTIIVGNTPCTVSTAPAEIRWTTDGSWVVTSSNYVNKNDVATAQALGLVKTNPTDGGVELNSNNQMVVHGWDSKASASDVTSLATRVTSAEGDIDALQSSVSEKLNTSDAVWTIDDSDDAIIVDDDFMTWMFQA